MFEFKFEFEKLITSSGLTLSLTILSLLLGFILAIILVFALNQKNTFIKHLASGFIYVTRSVPLLVQLFLIYYGCAQFEWVRNSFLWSFLQHPYVCALIALGLNSSAYTAILLQGGIDAIPKGEKEACNVLQMSLFTQMRRIILPRVLTTFWPAYTNETIMVLKSTSLVSTITLMDLMGVTRQIIANSYQTGEVLLITGGLYLMMSGLMTFVFSRVMGQAEI